MLRCRNGETVAIRVAIMGQGLVASHYVAGLYRLKRGEIEPYGVPLAKYKLPYTWKDQEVVLVYDVDERKVGKSLKEVVRYELSEYSKEVPVPDDVPEVEVRKGILLASAKGLPFPVSGLDEVMDPLEAVEKIADDLVEHDVDVVINLISTEPSEEIGKPEKVEEWIKEKRASAGQGYAYATYLAAKKSGKPIAFVNVIPTPLANDPAFETLFKEVGLILGDDGATGATPLTADLLEHLAERNRFVRYIVQFNIGGNTDFLVLTIPERNLMKEKTKSSIVEDILGYDAPHYIKPTGYVESIGDRKFVSLDIEWITFNGLVDEIIVNMRINDSPALAGLLVDLVRLSKIALEKGFRGTVYQINAFYMKNPGPKEAKNMARIRAYYELINWLKQIGALQ